MHGCGKCSKVSALIFLIVGLLFLLVDVGVWDFWNLQWWTILFLIIGVTCFAMGTCKDCQAMKK
tara:strand:+ start:13758 stop:13949 length:192 start_codon:yes stop_codon:yes gene_type:complete